MSKDSGGDPKKQSESFDKMRPMFVKIDEMGSVNGRKIVLPFSKIVKVTMSLRVMKYLHVLV
jgi:hypothetical protein